MKEKIRIMKTKPQVSEEEIRALMDFDDLLAKRKLLEEHSCTGSKKMVFKVVVAVLILSGAVFYFTENENTVERPGNTGATIPEIAPPVLKHDSLQPKARLKEESAVATQQNPQSAGKAEPKAPKTEKSGIEASPRRKGPVYVQAEPAQGYPALYDYFDQQLVYPPAALKDSVEGVVNVVFEIDTTGRAINTAVENSLGPLFDKEAIRLVENMPLWKPAQYNGKSVKSKISLPIDFGITRFPNPE